MAIGYVTFTEGADEYSTYDYYNTYGYLYDSFYLYGEGGDDTLTSSIFGRIAAEALYGGNGDDLLSADCYATSFASVSISGNYGQDRFYSPMNQSSAPSFTRFGSTITEFYLNSTDGSQIKVGVSDTTEIISFQLSGSTAYYLTEDIANGRIREVSITEAYDRTSGSNADWYLYGKDTYTPYHLTVTTTTSGNNKTMTGTSAADSIIAESGDSYGHDTLTGRDGNDTIKGFRGKDSLDGGNGDDLLKAGNGRDTLTGGLGVDSLFGGFGLNTFEDADDGYVDTLYLKSDQLAYNWIYDKAGNSPNGEKADIIGELDSNDKIVFQGTTGWLGWYTLANVTHTTPFGDTYSGIGIYFHETETSSAYLEGVYTGSNLNSTQLSSMFYVDNS